MSLPPPPTNFHISAPPSPKDDDHYHKASKQKPMNINTLAWTGNLWTPLPKQALVTSDNEKSENFNEPDTVPNLSEAQKEETFYSAELSHPNESLFDEKNVESPNHKNEKSTTAADPEFKDINRAVVDLGAHFLNRKDTEGSQFETIIEESKSSIDTMMLGKSNLESDDMIENNDDDNSNTDFRENVDEIKQPVEIKKQSVGHLNVSEIFLSSSKTFQNFDSESKEFEVSPGISTKEINKGQTSPISSVYESEVTHTKNEKLVEYPKFEINSEVTEDRNSIEETFHQRSHFQNESLEMLDPFFTESPRKHDQTTPKDFSQDYKKSSLRNAAFSFEDYDVPNDHAVATRKNDFDGQKFCNEKCRRRMLKVKNELDIAIEYITQNSRKEKDHKKKLIEENEKLRDQLQIQLRAVKAFEEYIKNFDDTVVPSLILQKDTKAAVEISDSEADEIDNGKDSKRIDELVSLVVAQAEELHAYEKHCNGIIAAFEDLEKKCRNQNETIQTLRNQLKESNIQPSQVALRQDGYDVFDKIINEEDNEDDR